MRTKKAKRQRTKEYKIAIFIEILPDAIGLFFVLKTFLSKF